MNYRATILSPVHVGDGRRLSPADFFTTRDGLAVFDFSRWLTEKPDRAEGLEAALSRLSGDTTLNALLTAEEQAKAEFRRYSVTAADFIRRRLSGEAAATGGAGAPAAAPKPVAVAPPPKPRTDLRGGLGGRLKLQLPNLPPGPATPEPAKPAVVAKAAAPRPAPVERPPRPEPEPAPERFVLAFLKSAQEAAYLPGSSIKGAFRTALLAHFSAEMPAFREYLGSTFGRGLFDYGFGPREADDEVNSVLLADRARMRFDYLAGLIVGDSDPVPADKALTVEMIRTLSPQTDRDGNPVGARPPARERFGDRGRGGPPRGGGMDRGPGRGGLGDRAGGPRLEPGSQDFKGAPVYVEAARVKAQFTGKAALDESLYAPHTARLLRWPEHLPPLSVPLLCKAANAYARRVLEREAEYFAGLMTDCARVAAFYRELQTRLDRAGERTAFLSLGFGAGWNRTTFGPALPDLPELDPIEFRRKFRLASHRLRSRFPKTRRLAMETFAVPRMPTGWVEIEFG
jgi:CRISPR/Cas system CSM-associated protein Csm5 (group 7 of RAMP superfamily)